MTLCPIIAAAFLATAQGGQASAPDSAPPPTPASDEGEVETPDDEVGDRIAAEKELIEEDDYEVKLSLPTESDYELWRSPGLRVQLGYGYGRQTPFDAGVGFSSHQISFRPAVRLSERWSLAIAMSYSVARGDFSGLKWSVTVEPTFHPVEALGISLGLGYGGMLGDRMDYRSGVIEPTDASFSRTADAGEWLQGCDGSGAAGLLRVEYLFVVGALFASGPYVQGDVQQTRCAEGRGGLNIETGESTAVYQWWAHRGWTLGWWLAWR